MKCPNCNNLLEGSGGSHPIKANPKWYPDAWNNILCIYCSVELSLVRKKVWLRTIATYLVFLPVIVILFFPHLFGDNRWVLMLLLFPAIATKIISDQIPSHQVESKTDPEGMRSTGPIRDQHGQNSQESKPPKKRDPKFNKKGYPYLGFIFGFTVFFVQFVGELFDYTAVMHWFVAVFIAVISTGYAISLKRLLETAEKRYLEKMKAWYGEFSKRSMNVVTIGYVALLMVFAITPLFIVAYFFIQIMLFGTVLLDAAQV